MNRYTQAHVDLLFVSVLTPILDIALVIKRSSPDVHHITERTTSYIAQHSPGSGRDIEKNSQSNVPLNFTLEYVQSDAKTFREVLRALLEQEPCKLRMFLYEVIASD